MPIEVTEQVAAVSAAVPVPGAPLLSSINGMDTAQKKVAELGLKGKEKPVDSDDPTDNDPCYLFELTKLAIKSGAKVDPINLEKLAPKFEEEAKTRMKKYTNAKVVSVFTGGTFTFLMYLLIEYLKTL